MSSRKWTEQDERLAALCAVLAKELGAVDRPHVKIILLSLIETVAKQAGYTTDDLLREIKAFYVLTMEKEN